jgi:hypothetical protein
MIMNAIKEGLEAKAKADAGAARLAEERWERSEAARAEALAETYARFEANQVLLSNLVSALLKRN